MRRVGQSIALFIVCFLLCFDAHGGSIRDVRQSIDRIQSIAPPFQFAVLGDSRDGDQVYGQMLGKILERKPAFLVHLGDMVPKPGKKEWEAFFELSKPVQVPFFPVVGNHDILVDTPKGRELYQKQFILPEGKNYYAFEVSGNLFLILDSEEGKGRILDGQLAWLDERLASSDAVLKFAFIHRPLFPPPDSLKLGRAMDKYVAERDLLHRRFVRSGVKVVFAGDDHRYHRSEKEGVVYIISGGAGAPLYPLVEQGGFFHYVWIWVEKERMVGEAVDLGGEIRDRFVIE